MSAPGKKPGNPQVERGRKYVYLLVRKCGIETRTAQRVVTGLRLKHNVPDRYRIIRTIIDNATPKQLQQLLIELALIRKRRMDGANTETLKEHAICFARQHHILLPFVPQSPRPARPQKTRAPIPQHKSTNPFVANLQERVAKGEPIANLTGIVKKSLKDASAKPSIIQAVVWLERALCALEENGELNTPHGREKLQEFWVFVENNFTVKKNAFH